MKDYAVSAQYPGTAPQLYDEWHVSHSGSRRLVCSDKHFYECDVAARKDGLPGIYARVPAGIDFTVEVSR